MPTKRLVSSDPGGSGSPQWLLGDVIATLAAAGLSPHFNSGGVQSVAPVSSSLGTSKTLTLELVDAFVDHGVDVGIHQAVDAALDVPAAASSHPAEPANLTEVGNVLNELKTDLNAHLANAAPHRGVGGEAGLTVAAVSTSDWVSTQGQANILANALQVAFNRHVQMAVPDFGVRSFDGLVTTVS